MSKGHIHIPFSFVIVKMGVLNCCDKGWFPAEEGDEGFGILYDMGKCLLANHELPSPRLEADKVASNDFDLLPATEKKKYKNG